MIIILKVLGIIGFQLAKSLKKDHFAFDKKVVLFYIRIINFFTLCDSIFLLLCRIA